MEICALYALHRDVRGDVRNRNLTMVPLQSFNFFSTFFIILHWCHIRCVRSHLSHPKWTSGRTSERTARGRRVRWEEEDVGRRISVSVIFSLLNQPVILPVKIHVHLCDSMCELLFVCLCVWTLFSLAESILQLECLFDSVNFSGKTLCNWTKQKVSPQKKKVYMCMCVWLCVCLLISNKWKNAINLPGHLWRDGGTLRFFTNIN